MRKIIAVLAASLAGCASYLHEETPKTPRDNHETRLERVVKRNIPQEIMQEGLPVRLEYSDIDGDGFDDLSLTVGRELDGEDRLVMIDLRTNGSLDSAYRIDRFDLGGGDLQARVAVDPLSLVGAYHRIVTNLDRPILDEHNPNIKTGLRSVSERPFHQRFVELKGVLDSLIVEDPEHDYSTRGAGYRFSLATTEVEVVLSKEGPEVMMSKIRLNDGTEYMTYDVGATGRVSRSEFGCSRASRDRAIGNAIYRIVISALHEQLVNRNFNLDLHAERLNRVLDYRCSDGA